MKSNDHNYFTREDLLDFYDLCQEINIEIKL